MSRSRDPLAQPKAIGEDVEELVLTTVDGLRAAVDPEDWYDAHAETVIGPRCAGDLTFGSIAVLDAGTRVEIKACKRYVSNGADSRPGRWMLQTDQHERLIDDRAVYLLAVYEEANGQKFLREMLAVPATILDEVLADSWYDVDRHESEVAQLAWPNVIGREVSADAE